MAKERYQILTVKEVPESVNASKIETTLYVATLRELQEAVPIVTAKTVPSAGIQLDPKFCAEIDNPQSNPAIEHENEVRLATRYSAQSLLKARKISQLFSCSWLDEDYAPSDLVSPEDMARNAVIRKVLLTANLPPDVYVIPSSEDDSGNGLLQLYRLCGQIQRDQRDNTELPPNRQGLRSRIILPDMPAWRLIRMSLLLAGQVFWEKGDSTYDTLTPPILSTYDICVQYAFTTVEWDEYVAQQLDILQPGQNQVPGYYNTTMPYPPRHSSEAVNITPQMVHEWATAPDQDREGNKWPFYPPKKGDDYESSLVRYIAPPYPYLTLTCT